MPAKRQQLTQAELILRALIPPTHPSFDREHQNKLRNKLHVIVESKAKSDLALWDEGDAFVTIRDLKLWAQLDFGSMNDFIVNGLGRARSWVDALMKFAETYPRAFVESHGRRKIKLAESYAKLTLTTTDDASLESLLLKVPADGEGERLSEIPFTKATESDITLAIQHQKKLAGDRDASAISVQQRAMLDLYEGLLNDELTKNGRAGEGTIRVRPSRDGDRSKDMVDLSVPYSELVAIFKRLAKGR